MNTINDVIAVSRRVGQVTLLVSLRTCCRNWNGFVFAICRFRHNMKTEGAALSPIPGWKPCEESVARLVREELAGAAGTRTRDLRFWRPSLYQLSYTPTRARAALT